MEDLLERAGTVAPGDAEVHGRRADVHRRRREAETSLMAKGMHRTAAQASEAVVDGA